MVVDMLGSLIPANVHVLLEISLGSESVFKPTVEDGLPHPDELRVTCLLSILKTVEGIEKHTPTEAQLHMVNGFAVVAPDAYAGIIDLVDIKINAEQVV